MISTRHLAACAAAGLAVLVGIPALSAGQTVAAPAGGHVHYAEPPRPAMQASPSGALAPRRRVGGTVIASTSVSLVAMQTPRHHLVPIRLRNTPLWLYLRSVRLSEKSVRL